MKPLDVSVVCCTGFERSRSRPGDGVRWGSSVAGRSSSEGFFSDSLRLRVLLWVTMVVYSSCRSASNPNPSCCPEHSWGRAWERRHRYGVKKLKVNVKKDLGSKMSRPKCKTCKMIDKTMAMCSEYYIYLTLQAGYQYRNMNLRYFDGFNA